MAAVFYKCYNTSDVSGHCGGHAFSSGSSSQSQGIKEKTLFFGPDYLPIFHIATYESIFHSDNGKNFRHHLWNV